jgi:hypothetical protein
MVSGGSDAEKNRRVFGADPRGGEPRCASALCLSVGAHRWGMIRADTTGRTHDG